MMKKLRPVAAVVLQKGDRYLLVRKPRKNNAWQFPQGGVDIGETLAEAVMRELAEECGSDLQVDLFPDQIAEYRYEFPADFLRHHSEFAGARVTFFKAKYISGEPKVDGEEIVEARWCMKKEIENLVAEKYWEVVKSCL